MLQTILNFSDKIQSQLDNFVDHLLMTRGKKNCLSMAQEMGTSVKRLYRYLKSCATDDIIEKSLIEAANKIMESEWRVFAVDGTMISKIYASTMECLRYDKDGATKQVAKGLSLMVAAIGDTFAALPIGFDYYLSKINLAYKKKTDLAFDLVDRFFELSHAAYACFDGAFASLEFMNKLSIRNIPYIMRFTKGRYIVCDGIIAKVECQKNLKLVRNERAKTIKCTYKGLECYMTAFKRRDKNHQWETIYLVSSMNLPAKQLVELYNKRWKLEKSFRTMKQSLGITDCQSVSSKSQHAHILAVFVSYAQSIFEAKLNHFPSAEEWIKKLRSKNSKFF